MLNNEPMRGRRHPLRSYADPFKDRGQAFAMAPLLSVSIVSLLLGALSPSPSLGMTHHVPRDYSTIQSAIAAAASGDSILVGPGVYDENLDTQGKSLSLIGPAGAAATVVDGGGRATVLAMSGGGLVEGFTLRNGHDQEHWLGGGIRVTGPFATTIRNNIIEDNRAGVYFDAGAGGGIYVDLEADSVLIETNTIRNNYAGGQGGGIRSWSLNAVIRANVITGNGCHLGGAGASVGGREVFVENLVASNWSDAFAAGVHADGAPEVIRNTIVANSLRSGWLVAGLLIDGAALVAGNIVARNVGAYPGTGIGIECRSIYFPARVECNDSWGNPGGDYYWFAGGLCDTSGGNNRSLDPLFCNEAAGDYRLSTNSPCAPDHSVPCGLIGALPPVCGVTRVDRVSWRKLKTIYR
jgi:hypothetical protein